MANAQVLTSKSVTLPGWLVVSIAVHVGLVGVFLPMSIAPVPMASGAGVTQPIPFELLEDPRPLIPATVAAPADRFALAPVTHSSRATNTSPPRSVTSPGATPALVSHSQDAPAAPPSATLLPIPSGSTRGDGEPPLPTQVGATPARPPTPEGAAERARATVALDAQVKHSYFGALRAAVERHREYPRAARRARLQGTVVLRLSVSRTGHLQILRVTRSSGEELLDNAALAAVRMVGMFPVAPTALDGEQFTVELPFVFRLQ